MRENSGKHWVINWFFNGVRRENERKKGWMGRIHQGDVGFELGQ